MFFELNLDLDCCVYDLTGQVLKVYNHEFGCNETEVTDYWFSDLDKADKKYFEQLLQEPSMFSMGAPIKDSVETINKLRDKGFKIRFITMPEFSVTCYYEKCQWLKKYFPWVNLQKDLIATGDKSVCAQNNRILIDDSIDNLRAWSSAGGFGVAYAQPWNEEYTGLRVNNWTELYQLLMKLER